MFIIFLAVAATGLLILIYNRLVALRQTRKNAYADIDVQLHMRYDLIPNMVKTVQQYATHEQQVLENVTAARATAMQAASIGERGRAELALDGALLKMLSVSENYPTLKADGNFIKLQDELSNVERSIAAARRFFNNATSEFNIACQQFPANFISGLLGFKEQPYLEAGTEQRAMHEAPPKIDFQ